ncbi:MAG: SDR family oxidoreductase [Thiogranum sp.]
MDWGRIVAYITGTVDQELLLRNEYLAAENRTLKSQLKTRLQRAGHVNYATSKGGVNMMMQSIAQEMAAKKIPVNSIAPGGIRTPINTAAWSTPEAEAELLELIPYQRIGNPEDIARAAVWLASDESEYVTGTSLFVDGGMTPYPRFREGG